MSPVLRALIAAAVILSVAFTVSACGRKSPPVAPGDAEQSGDAQ